MRRLGNESQPIEEFLHDDGGVLPDDHPHVQLYQDVTPLWHDGQSPEDLDGRIGDGYSCGFSGGFEGGIVMAISKPEWAVGWYQKLREFYLADNHTPEDLADWDDFAERTARAIPIETTGAPTPSAVDSSSVRDGLERET
jgi:hypothetical protein